MDDDVSALAQLVGDIDDFGSNHWGQKPLLRRSCGDLCWLLSVERVEEILLSSARRPSFRLVQDGATLPPERSTTTIRFAGRNIDDVANVTEIFAALDDGATLVLQGLQRTVLDVGQYCAQLERAMSHPVQANAYLTPAGATGLAPHRDDHDVIVVQLDGHKNWDIEGLGAVAVEPGDVVYLPAGTTHSAAAQEQLSLHLTFGILRVTHGDALRRALAGLDASDRTRPLPLGYARPERTVDLTNDLRQSLAALSDQLGRLDAVRVADTETARARSRRRPLTIGSLRSILSVDDVDGDTLVVRRPDLVACLIDAPDDEGRTVLELVDRRIRFPAAMRPALIGLLGGEVAQVAALPGLDPGSQVVLARRLIREGCLVAEPREEDPRRARVTRSAARRPRS